MDECEYELGDVVRIPLLDGGTGYGVIAGIGTDNYVFLFGFLDHPADRLAEISMCDTVCLLEHRDDRIAFADWPVVSRVENFAEQWFIPPLRGGSSKRYRIYVRSSDLSKKNYWNKCLPPEDAAQLPEDIGRGGPDFMSHALSAIVAGTRVPVRADESMVASWRRSLAVLSEAEPN